MVFENTEKNRNLVQKMAAVIDAEPDYRATVYRDWNCGQEIRIEISTEDVLHCPFIVSSYCGRDRVLTKVRMLAPDMWSRTHPEWKEWLSRLDGLVEKLNDCLKEVA